MVRGISIKKITDNTPNEDSYRLGERFMAISDGAGGCGVFSDEWSRYLVDHLDESQPITSFLELDQWLDSIWERFYNDHEKVALSYDGIFQHKFYAEGSCATLAAAWLEDNNSCRWMTYGDSVIFHYRKNSRILEHSFTKLIDFSKSPYLISCKDPTPENGFRSGIYILNEDSIVFACTDALAYYILMMYMISDYDKYHFEVEDLANNKSINSSMIKIAKSIQGIDFYKDVLLSLESASESEQSFMLLMKKLNDTGLIDVDDYTIVFL